MKKEKHSIIIGLALFLAMMLFLPVQTTFADVTTDSTITFTQGTNPPVDPNPPTEPGGELPDPPTEPGGELPEIPDPLDHNLKPGGSGDGSNNFLPQTNEAQQSYFVWLGWLLVGMALLIYQFRKEVTDDV